MANRPAILLNDLHFQLWTRWPVPSREWSSSNNQRRLGPRVPRGKEISKSRTRTISCSRMKTWTARNGPDVAFPASRSRKPFVRQSIHIGLNVLAIDMISRSFDSSTWTDANDAHKFRKYLDTWPSVEAKHKVSDWSSGPSRDQSWSVAFVIGSLVVSSLKVIPSSCRTQVPQVPPVGLEHRS